MLWGIEKLNEKERHDGEFFFGCCSWEMLSSHQGYSIIRLQCYQPPLAAVGGHLCSIVPEPKAMQSCQKCFEDHCILWLPQSYRLQVASCFHHGNEAVCWSTPVVPSVEYGPIWYLNGSNCGDLFMLWVFSATQPDRRAPGSPPEHKLCLLSTHGDTPPCPLYVQYNTHSSGLFCVSQYTFTLIHQYFIPSQLHVNKHRKSQTNWN